MKKLLSFVLISLFVKTCNIGEYSLPPVSMKIDYADNCIAENFKVTISLGLYPFNQYKEEWKDSCGAYIYVQNTTGANGYLDRKLNYEAGIFLLNVEGIEDIYGFDNTDRFGKYTYNFTKEFSVEASLLEEKSGWISFESGIYNLKEDERFSRSFYQCYADVPYSIDNDGTIKFKRGKNDDKQTFSCIPMSSKPSN